MPSAEQDTILRIALGMFARDPKSDATETQRTWIRDRMQYLTREAGYLPLTAREKVHLKGPLLTYIGIHHVRILDIVMAQFEEQH